MRKGIVRTASITLLIAGFLLFLYGFELDIGLLTVGQSRMRYVDTKF